MIDADTILSNFRRNVLKRMDQLELSRADLAKKLGWKPPTLYPYLDESNPKEPGVRTICKFAEALETTYQKLISR